MARAKPLERAATGGEFSVPEDLHHAAALLAEHLRHLLPGHVANLFVVRADERV